MAGRDRNTGLTGDEKQDVLITQQETTAPQTVNSSSNSSTSGSSSTRGTQTQSGKSVTTGGKTTTGTSTTNTTQKGSSVTQNIGDDALAALNTLISQLLGGGTPEQQRITAERGTEIQRNRAQQEKYSKEAATADAKSLSAYFARTFGEQALGGINRAAEASGASASTTRALLTQDAVARQTEVAAKVGVDAATAYGQIYNQLANTLEALTRADPNGAANLLIQALNVAKGTVTKTNSSSEGTSVTNTNQKEFSDSTTKTEQVSNTDQTTQSTQNTAGKDVKTTSGGQKNTQEFRDYQNGNAAPTLVNPGGAPIADAQGDGYIIINPATNDSGGFSISAGENNPLDTVDFGPGSYDQSEYLPA